MKINYTTDADKSCSTDFLLQREVFSAHILLSNKLKKPLIIHCVNAYDEIIKLLKELKNNVPVIFHGFNKKETIAASLIKKGFYLSFGKGLSKENLKQLFKNISLAKVFLETDDDSLTIEEIYLMAAKIAGITTETLQIQIKKNAIELFGEGLF